MEADFSGYATKAGLKCSDGRIIMPNAFEHQDKLKVPLVWSHGHKDPELILGHAILENRGPEHPEGAGTYCYGFFNGNAKAKATKLAVQHGDVTYMSIFANDLIERAKQVFHGAIREVSLCLTGANPGAQINPVSIRHSDDWEEEIEGAAIIYTGLEISHSEGGPVEAPTPEVPGDEGHEADAAEEQGEENNEEQQGEEESGSTTDPNPNPDSPETDPNPGTTGGEVEHAVTAEKTAQDIYDGMSEEEQNLVHYMIGEALAAADTTASHSENDNEGDLTHQEGIEDMTRNVFEQNGSTATKKRPTLTHDQLTTIVEDAKKPGETLRTSFLAHATEYGIEEIDVLFPDAQSLTPTPELIARQQVWVPLVVDAAKHSPFSRVKSTAADITADEARARGYVKGNLKKDEIIKLLKRVTTPTTIYKKQRLDRDDIIDITDLDVVAWLKVEMRLMLNEELGRAVLIGDGREADDEDKIDEDCLRPIAFDDDMYNTKVVIQTNASAEDIVEAVIRARKNYKGTGRPTFFTTDDVITDLLLIKDKMGRYVYDDEAGLAAKLRVTQLVPVEVLESEPDIIGIMVNMSDYTIGADRGGQLSMFDDFDIDYNQYKYLMETRVSGALTKPKSAVTVSRVSGTTVTPTAPTYDPATHTIAVPATTGVTYYNEADDTVLTGDVVIGETTDVVARPNSGYNFPHNTDADWTFAYTA